MISLPKPLTSFIGRERELAQAKRLLQGSYLVTLTGPGGSGKTRLCIALAAEVAGDYPDGVYFVPLAPVRDPGLVASTIAQSIGLQDARDRPLMEHLVSQLRERQLLIVLDNFEHLLAGVAVVTQLLQETSAVRILVSSRVTTGAPASRCSKLSSTISSCRSRSWLTRCSIKGRSLASCSPMLWAIVEATSPGSRTGASGTK